MKTYEIWSEGYLATGMEGRPEPAHLIGTETAASFDDAVSQHIAKLPEERRRYFRRGENGLWSDWGCRLFDNRADAEKSFG